MTSNHDDRMSAIEALMDASFTSAFTNLGFSKAGIKREGWNTTFTYLGTDVGFEVELDWREMDVFVLVLRLEHGKPPGGYYVSNGKRSRMHLESVLDGAGQRSPQPEKHPHPTRYLESKIEWYLRQLAVHGPTVVQKGVELFPKA